MKNENSFSIDFIVRKTKSNQQVGYLSAKVTVNGYSTEISLNEKIQIQSWNARSESVNGKGLQVEGLNKHINDVRFRITESKRALERDRWEVSADSVRLHYHNKHISQQPPSSGHTLGDLILKHEHLECSGNKLKRGTTKNYEATKRYLNNFLVHQFGVADVDLLMITYEVLLELEAYIRLHPLKKHDPCLGNGVYKHMERVNKMFTMAKNMRWIKESPFDLYQSKRKKVHRENLSIEDFVKIENATFSNPKLTFVRDLFVCDCYLGVSYIDLMELADKHFTEIDGKLFCTIYRLKSSELCGIPVPEIAQRIITKYKESPGAIERHKIFPYISNQEFNRSLKVIAEILSINVDLDTRMARRFFAKEVNLKNGVPLETVSKLMGHSKISTTKENYADVDEGKILADTAEVQYRFGQKKNMLLSRLNLNSSEM